MPTTMEIKELIDSFEQNFREYVRLLRSLNGDNQTQFLTSIIPDSKISLPHLVSLEDEIVELRLKKIIKEEHPYLPQINLDKIRNNSPYERRPLPEICDHFLRQKKELLKLLYSLPPETWERTGVHEMEGHVPFKEFIRRMTVKDRQILGNFKSVINAH